MKDARYWMHCAREEERAGRYGNASVLWLAASELSRIGSDRRAWLLTRHERCSGRSR